MDSDALKALIRDSQKSKRLDLSHHDLDDVPQEVVKLRHLEKLDLSYNNLTSIPEALFKNNKDLIEVDVSSNKLQALPESLAELEAIKVVNASSNQLRGVPSNFSSLWYDRGQKIYMWGTVYYSGGRFEAKINLDNNPDLDIKDLLKREPQLVQEELNRRQTREKEQKEQQKIVEKAEFEKEKQMTVDENIERRRERKNNDKTRTKNMRIDRND